MLHPKKGQFCVYVLECADMSFYCGSTSDLEKRIYTHNHLKSGAHYTKIRRPVALKYFEIHKDYKNVRKREGEIKRMSREEKVKLVKKRDDF